MNSKINRTGNKSTVLIGAISRKGNIKMDAETYASYFDLDVNDPRAIESHMQASESCDPEYGNIEYLRTA